MSALEELLAEEEARALSDLSGSLAAAGERALRSVDVRGWVRARPLLAVGLAGLCGLGLARLIAGGITSAARSAAPSSAVVAVRKQLLAMAFRAALRVSGPLGAGSS